MIDQQLYMSLRDHLNAELACHRALLTVAEQQQRALISHDVATFANLTKQSEPQINEQQRLRKQRVQLLTQISTALAPDNGIKVDEKLSALLRIIKQAPEPLLSELKTRYVLLKDALDKLRAVHERNQALLRQGLGLMRDLVRALTGEADVQGYDRRGLGDSTTGNGRLVNLAG